MLTILISGADCAETVLDINCLTAEAETPISPAFFMNCLLVGAIYTSIKYLQSAYSGVHAIWN